MRAKKISRRALLRGAGGVAVALPLLECMSHGLAKAQAMAPQRYGIVFAGQSIGGDNYPKDRQRVAGNNLTESGHFIAPEESGAGYSITTPLEPLAALREEVSVVSGMRIPYSTNSTDPSAVPVGGAYRDFHGGASGPLLCGTRSESSGYFCRSITSDQMVADYNAGQTTLPSLVLRAQPSWYLSGSSYAGRQYISYRGHRDPVAAQTSPHVAFRDLFAGFSPVNDAMVSRADFLQRARLSVLDAVMEKRQRLVSRVGTGDRIRLEQHFDEIRALETRLSSSLVSGGGACQALASPGEDPAIGGNNAGSGSDSISTNTGYSGEHARARLHADLVHMAFVCDLTRSATLQVTTFQSHMNMYQVTSDMGLPIRADLHEVGHNGDQDNRGQQVVSTCLKWQISHYAYLLEKMAATQEGERTLLDNSAMIFMPEGGHGRQLNDASTEDQTHSTENMVMLVAGRSGGLNPGRHVPTAGAHPAQCLISCMQAVGVGADQLGEVSGRIDGLFA